MVNRIEEMLFPANSEANVASEKTDLFQFVMSEFLLYEVSWKLIKIRGMLLLLSIV